MRRFFLLAALLALLAACSTTDSTKSTRTPPTPAAPTTLDTSKWRPSVMVPKGPFYSAPLQRGTFTQGEPTPWLLSQAAGDEVEMRALLISATENNTQNEPTVGAWKALLEQSGIPYDHLVATTTTLTQEMLVGAGEVGRYQAILLSTSNLVYEDGDTYPSAFTQAEWNTLFAYEQAYGVRQVALYAEPFSVPVGDPYGLDSHDGYTGLDGTVLTPTAAGLEVFTDLNPDSHVELYGTVGFPSHGPADGTTPLLMAGSDILAVRIQNGGRDRVALLYNNPAWGDHAAGEHDTPATYVQQIGPSLLRWAMGGIHIGERRASFQADVDDWFITTGIWDVDLGQIVDEPGFDLSANDAVVAANLQAALRAAGGGIAPAFTWSMAFNGEGANFGSVVDCAQPVEAHTLSSMTRCLAGDFWWVNHTWDHQYMDWIPGVGVNLTVPQVTSRLTQNDDLATEFGFGVNYSPRSLVTGDISGLGWYDPAGPEHEPVHKVDFGLAFASPYFAQAAFDTGHTFVASNMSTPSHEPDCWSCGIYLTLDDNAIEVFPDVELFLVPRWPTNLFATVTTPEAVVDAYNRIYGPGGTDPIPGISEPLTYEQILDIDTEIALGHVLAGSPYPHYFHVPNLYNYAPGHSTLYDWTLELFERYSALVNEPILSMRNDEFGAYVKARTDFLNAGVTGVWNRATGEVTLSSANGGPVFFTGASMGGGSDDLTYNGRVISERELAPGASLTFNLNPPVAPTITAFAADPSAIEYGQTTTLAWNVTGVATDIAIRVQGAATNEAAGLGPSGTWTTPALLADTTYELVATWAGGDPVVASATVTVGPQPAPVIGSFTATPGTITAGQTTQLGWTVSGGASTNVAIRVQGAETPLATGLDRTGTLTTPSLTSDTTYELVVGWTGGPDVMQTVSVTVNPVAPVATLSANPPAITAGDASSLAWEVTGDYTSITLRVHEGAEIATGLPRDGSRSVTPSATTTYDLVVAWVGGDPVVRQTTVTVAPAPIRPTIKFGAEPTSIVAGETTRLSWTVTGSAQTITLRVKDGAEVATGLNTVGGRTLGPTATTTYELVATWPGGDPVVAETTVTVGAGYTLSLVLGGEGFGLVVSSPQGIVCIDDCTATYPAGTTITLAPVALLGSTFEGFTGACEGDTCTLTIDRDLEIGARFGFED